ncbi:hypothetical protein C2E23DRAFT_722560, partial [Lenzites betulinus]
MSLSHSTANASNLFNVPKLAQDGSNWITYKEQMHTVLGARGLMRHLIGTARRPPSPPPWPRTKSEPATSTKQMPGPTTTSTTPSTVEAAEAKLDDYEQKEFATRQQIYGTITDSLLLKVKDLSTASAVWSAVMKEHKGKSEM